jgi:hypothetical protein
LERSARREFGYIDLAGLSVAIVMPEAANSKIRIVGEFTAGGITIGDVALVGQPDQITIESGFGESPYQFSPSTVAAITAENNAIVIRHTLIDYPEAISFSPSGSVEVAVLLERINQIGFRPQATIDAIPLRPGSPVRLNWVIPIVILGLVMVGVDSLLGWAKHGALTGNRYSPLGAGAFLTIFLVIKYFRLIHGLLLKPERTIGEIMPTLNLLIIVFAWFSVASLLILINLSEPLSLAISTGMLWVVGMLMRQERQAG